MAKIRTNLPKQQEPKSEDSTRVLVTETREVELPGPPDVPAGKIAFRMVYHTGEFRDIIGDSRFDCTGKAIKQAGLDKINFYSDQIVSFKKIV